MAKVVENGYPIFTGLDGLPLDEGYIYIGVAGFNPITNPQAAFWDEDLTVPASNIRTVNGYASYQGSPGRLFTENVHSLLVKDSRGQTVYYQPTSVVNAIDYGDSGVPMGGVLPENGLVFDDFLALGTLNVSATAYEDLFNSGIDLIEDNGDGTFDILNSGYTTDWQANSDWTDWELTVTHSLKKTMSDLDIVVEVSSTGVDATAVRIIDTAYDAASGADEITGAALYNVSTDAFIVQSGTNGIDLVDTDGTKLRLAAQSWYYKVTAKRRDLPYPGQIKATVTASGGAGGASAGVEFTGTAGEALTALDLVYRGQSDGKFYKADPTDIYKSFVSGFVESDATTDQTVTVVNKGVLPGFAGLTIGTDYYLDDAGAYTDLASLADTDNCVRVGRAVDTDTMEVSVALPLFRNRTYLQDQIDSLSNGAQIRAVGDSWFSVREPSSVAPLGGLPDDYDNAVSQAIYAALFALVGHMWNAAHVAVGDADLSGSITMFYPTPPPGYYPRSAAKPHDFTNADVASDSGLRIVAPSYWQQDKADLTGRPVRFEVVSGSAPTGLVDGTVYYLIPYASTAFTKLATSEANAIAGTAIAYTDTGSGSFRLVQAGTQIDDATQRLVGSVELRNATPVDPSGPFSQGASAGNVRGSGANDAFYLDFDNADAGLRTSNEDRPATIYEYRYTQCLPAYSDPNVITPSAFVGQSEYDVPDFQAHLQTVSHSLNALPKDMDIKVEVSNDGGTTYYEVAQMQDGTSPSSVDVGYNVISDGSTTVSSFQIQFAAGGIGIVNKTTGATARIAAPGASGKLRVSMRAANIVGAVVYPETYRASNPYDISSSSKVSDAIPLAAESMGMVIRRSWKGGDDPSTKNFQLNMSEPVIMEDGTSLAWGTLKDGTEIAGYGTGHIVIRSDGTNWHVDSFEDMLTEPTDGFETERKLNGRMIKLVSEKAISNAGTALVFDIAFKNTGYAMLQTWVETTTTAIKALDIGSASPKAVDGITVVSRRTDSLAVSNGTFDIQFIGQWY